jgi:sugar-specific transcriptional regulator TrmB
MDISILEEIGMTEAEAKTYLALLELGTSTAGPIVRKSQLQNSVVHMILPKLVEKGFATFIMRGGIKEYSASEPENIIRFIEEKKSKFMKILPELKQRRGKKIQQEAEVYQGFKGMKVMLNELVKDAKKADEFLFFVFDTKKSEDYEKVYEFYRKDFHEERKKLGLVEKGIAPLRLKEYILRAKWTKKCVKFTNLPVLTNISILNNKVAFTPWDNGEICFLIKSEQLAEEFRNYFYSIWSNF